MMSLLLFFFSLASHAEPLQVVGVEYTHPADMGSCGLLKAREAERQKVIREFLYLHKLSDKGQASALLRANSLLINKYFMPDETWRDQNAEVTVVANIPEGMRQEILKVGMGGVYLSIRAPGLVWQSFAYQLPSDLEYRVDADVRTLTIRYLTYLSVTCLDSLYVPDLRWVPEANAPTRPNSRVILEQLGVLP